MAVYQSLCAEDEEHNKNIDFSNGPGPNLKGPEY